MKISKSTVGILTSMVLLSILFASVVNLLSTDALKTSNTNNNLNYEKMGDSNEHLIWFLQISDIHISIFRDPSRITEFKEFCQYTVDAIKPYVVLASGDLTDAKTSDSIGSRQFESEWAYYRDILKECNIQERTAWLDIRGNHDNFNVVDKNSNQNYFTNYSIQGKQHPRSYMYQIAEGNVVYSFIGIDACLEPGPKRPFNFIGMLDEDEVQEIQHLIRKVEKKGSNYTVWFGHFPTSCILTPTSISVRNLIGNHRNSLVYVCGHLHKLGGLVPNMYTLQKAGFLELELGDWKDNRMYRIMAIDHGLLSFIDVEHRQWPIVLVTNPKHPLFFNFHKENYETIKFSSHIRMLVFSLAAIDFVKVKIDDGDWINCEQKELPLFVAKWNPLQYLDGLHKIQIHVKDIDGREKIYSQPFLLDGNHLSFDVISRIILMMDASTIFKSLFGTLLGFTVLPLCILRILYELSKAGKIREINLRGGCFKLFIKKLWILCTVDRLFYPLVFYPLYLTFGPWSIGYLIEDYIGIVFAWGIFIHGTFLPGSFTYAYGFIQLLTFHVPLMFILSHTVYRRYRSYVSKSDITRSKICEIASHIPFCILFTLQAIMAYMFWLAYGTLAFILGPLRTWSVILAAILYYFALKLPEKCLL